MKWNWGGVEMLQSVFLLGGGGGGMQESEFDKLRDFLTPTNKNKTMPDCNTLLEGNTYS